jgi:hypothetical protein
LLLLSDEANVSPARHILTHCGATIHIDMEDQCECGIWGSTQSPQAYASVIEPTNYMKLSKKIFAGADLANLSPYNPIVREITKDFKPTNIPTKII